MDFNDSNDFIDTEYEDIENISDKVIRGEALFFSTTQVANILGEEASTIRYWSKRFENLLDIEVSNRNKQYKKSDIAKLKFIQKLAREDGLSLQQIQDYCNTKGFDIDDIEKAVLDRNNPLAIQAFTSAVMAEMNNNLNKIAEKILEQVNEANKNHAIEQKELNEKLREDIIVTVDEVVTERNETLLGKMDTKLTEFKSIIDDKELASKNRDIEMIDILRNNMEQRKENNLKEESKGFWSKIFKK